MPHPRHPAELRSRVYLASKDGYQDAVLPTGTFTGTPEDTLDCACDLYLSIPDL